MNGVQHVEVWVADLVVASASWSWLLGRLGFDLASEWPGVEG